ncbi:aldehyde dehydrogenase family protein [Amycolatopsis panacis]|uniref:aldehyde dehydrogenase family protein n=1 Tax=Amycolatopsis panacis TaxID=2340917 RepID=UPI002D798A9C|nr:aldehyde dehydrogenase family protein [Amycolatopsis panacis]
MRLVNSGAFGNGATIFTNDGGPARRFRKTAQAGMIGITVPVATFSFGGWKASMFGDTKAHGTEGVKFCTQLEAVTSRRPDPSHGGLDLGFPATTSSERPRHHVSTQRVVLPAGISAQRKLGIRGGHQHSRLAVHRDPGCRARRRQSRAVAA